MIRIETAIYGSRSGSHGLLSSSLPEKQLPQRLSGWGDKPPGTLPPGVIWSPVFGCGRDGDYYVIWRSIQDGRGRAGMVQTHALLIPLRSLGAVEDLRPLLATMPTAIQETPAAKALELLPEDLRPKPPSDPASYPSLAAILEQGPQGSIVIPSDMDPEALVTALWLRLWPGARRRLACRMVLGPGQLDNPPPLLVTTPRDVLPSWHRHTTLSEAPSAIGAEFLCGAPPEKLSELLSALGPADFGLDALDVLKSLLPLHAGWRRRELSTDELILFMRRTLFLSPEADAAADLKAALSRAIAETLGAASFKTLLSLANLGLWLVPAQQSLGESVAARLGSMLGELEPAELFESLKRARSSGTERWWSEAAWKAWSAWTATPSSGKAYQIWRCLEKEPALVRHLGGRLPTTEAWERSLLQTCPTDPAKDAIGAMVDLAREQHWPRLHGALIPRVLNPHDALRAHRVMIAEGTAGLPELAAQLNDEALIDLYVQSRDEGLLTQSVKRISARPSLLRRMDVSEAGWRQLWLESLRAELGPKEGILPYQGAYFSLLEMLIEGEPVVPELAERLMRGGLTALHHPRRAELWGSLPQSIGTLLLATTAEKWLRSADQHTAGGALEAPLRDALIQRFDRGPQGLNADPAELMAIINALGDVSELSALAWLKGWWRQHNRQTSTLDKLALAELGRVCVQRRWKELVRWANNGWSLREAMEPLLVEAREFLSWLDYLRLRSYSVSEDEWWSAFEDYASKLYDDGPASGALWHDAGGERAQLPRDGSPRDQWRWTMTQLRQGRLLHGGGRALLKAMRQDFRENEALKLLHDRAPWKNR